MQTERSHGRLLIFMLAGVAALGSMAIHMVVPALPHMAEQFGVAPAAAQRVVSLYIVALAGGQLVAGPLIDRLGRRPVLFGGMAIYLASALGAATTTSLPALLACRALQGFGGAAGIVSSRVIVSGLGGPEEAGRRQAALMGAVLLSPAIAPVLGGIIVTLDGWPAIFLLQAGLAIALVLPCRRFLPANAAPDPVRPPLLGAFARLLANLRFVRLAGAMALSSSALYMFLTVAPFLLVDRWGLTEGEAGICFLAAALGGIAGTFLVGPLERWGDPRPVGLMTGTAGSLLVLAAALLDFDSWPALVLPVTVMTVGAGISGPAIIASVVEVDRSLSGTATSLAGALQMATAGAASALVGLLGPPSLLLLSACMVASATGALLLGHRRRKA